MCPLDMSKPLFKKMSTRMVSRPEQVYLKTLKGSTSSTTGRLLSMQIESINPANLERNGAVETHDEEEVIECFVKARKAQQEWKRIQVLERASIIARVNESLVDQIDELSLLVCREVGKPPLEAFISEIYGAIDSTFHYYNSVSEVLGEEREIPLGFYSSLDKRSFVYRKPAGVVAVIGPFNFPFVIPFQQIVQSLIAGNGVVFKPSSEAVLVGEAIYNILHTIEELPEDLMQVVFGSGSKLGRVMVDEANRVIFTGSTNTGKAIMRRAANTLTPVALELGGKSAMVVLPDANMDRAVRAAAWGCFINSGQVCASVKRLFLHESIKDDFTSRLVEFTNKLVQGYPEEPGTDIGAMVNQEQMQLVLDAIERAREQGAKVLSGGRRNPDLEGYFIEPTLLGECTNSMDCVQQEIFGPVLVILSFSSEAEAIKMVNDNPYGLTSSIWTENIDRGKQFAREIDTGTMMVNECVYSFALAMTPWGGPKASGIGRTHGEYGFLEVTEPFHLNVDRYKEMDPWWMPYDKDFREIMDNFKHIAKSLVVKQ
ncbi:aldehyde dehydrogenase family protein [Candidatus Bathyarchaeota archaeon]|nr:aldehyde dehydrogenase family protein [Candidatus Bathyarchaeota archaeon]